MTCGTSVLRGANLYGTDLGGADLGDKKLIGTRPVIIIGPIGSRGAYLTGYNTDGGVMVMTGCFFGTIEEFLSAVKSTHGDNEHRREYECAIMLIREHCRIWGDK